MQKAKSPTRAQAKKAAATPAVPKRQPPQKAAADPNAKSIAATTSPANIRSKQVGGSRGPSMRQRQGSSSLTPRRTDPKRRQQEEAKAAVTSKEVDPTQAAEKLGRQDGERASDVEQKPAAQEVDQPTEEQKLGEPQQALIADIGGTQLGDGQSTIASTGKSPTASAADTEKVQVRDSASPTTDGRAKSKETAASETEQVPSSTPRPASRPSDAAPPTALEALQLENLRLRQEVERQKSQIEELRSSCRTVEAASIPQASPAVEVRTQPNLIGDLLVTTTQLVAAPCLSSTPRAQCPPSNPATPCPSNNYRLPCTSSSPRVDQRASIRAPTAIGAASTVDAIRAPLSARGTSSVPVPPPSRKWPVPVPAPGGYVPVYASPVASCRAGPTAPASPRLPAEQAPSPVWAKMAAVYNAQNVRPATTTAMQGRFTPVQVPQPGTPRPFGIVTACTTSASHQNISARTMPLCSLQPVCYGGAPMVFTPRDTRPAGSASVRSASASL